MGLNFTYKQVIDFIESDINNIIAVDKYDRDLLIQFLRTPLGQEYVDDYFKDISDEILMDYLENEIQEENLKTRIEKCIFYSKSKKNSIIELKLSFIYLNSDFYKKNGLLNKIKQIVNKHKKK